jgi:RNA polymerase sigma-54 factor
MIQAMQVLQLPALDLVERIQQELDENPFLELAEPEPGEGDASGDQAQDDGPTDAESAGVESMLEELERYERDFSDGSAPRVASEDVDKKLEAMQNTPDDTQTLAEALSEELAFIELNDRRRALAEYLLYSLDEHGYLKEPLEEIARACNEEAPTGTDELATIDADSFANALGEEPVTVEELEDVLSELRAVAHPALGARDLRECLLLQIDAHGIEDSLLRVIVTHHLEDLEQNRLPRIAKAVDLEIEDVKNAIEMLRGLDPHPGAGYGQSRAAVITPEVIVEEVDGDYEVRLDRQRVPEITLSPAYRELLRKAEKGDGVRDWVKKRLESARWFIDAVRQRQSTLERISSVIFTRQRDFLDKGVRALHPLRMQEVADEVGVHISTVSRAVSGKYAQTPRGIHPLKYFFLGGTTKNTGEVASRASIQQRIADLVAQEDPDHPLSDDQIAAQLEERDNVKLARRTVTKYRKALGLGASSQRRKF